MKAQRRAPDEAALPEGLNLLGRRQLPVILTSQAADCGLCCLAMVACYWGHDLDLNGARRVHAPSMLGMKLRDIMEAAAKLDLAPRALRVDVSAVDKIATPAILHWNEDHFVVLRAVRGKRIIIHDPATGMRELSRAAIAAHFTGIVLELAPTAQFAPQTARTATPLSALWTQSRGFPAGLAQVITLSAALEIATIAAPFQLQLIVDEVVYRADISLLGVIAVGFAGLAIVQTLIEGLRAWTLRYFGALVSYQIVGNLVHHLFRLPASFFETRHLGDIVSRLNSSQPIKDFITQGFLAALIDGSMALLTGVILFVYSPVLALVVIASVAVSLAISVAAYPALRRRMEEEILANAKERSHLMESVRASTTIKVMGLEVERENAWRNLYADVINVSFSVGKNQIALSSAQMLIATLQTVFVLYLAASAILAGAGFSVGMLFAFLAFRQTFTDRCNALINQALQFRALGLHLDRIGDIVHAEPEIVEQTDDAGAVTGAFRFKAVSFRYGSGDPLVLDGVDIDIEAGEFIAITGASGSGKSTLLKLMLGLYPPTAGVIELGGHAASPALFRRWRAEAGVVAQDDKLLAGSLAENISLFSADIDMARVQRAAEAAHVHQDIIRMPMRYHSLVGDMGAALSGGQRQRILLARALYRQPSILILDEGTANLDEATEQLIADVIAGLPITRVVVAHRPALIRKASRVLVLEEGRVQAVRRRPSVANAE